MRRRLKLLLVLLVLAALAVHVLWWYWPRQRAAAPDPDGLPSRMLASGAFETCFWIPFPHQNLAALAGAVGDWPGWVAAASRAGGVPPPDLPGFGPFQVPPARELAACADRDAGGDGNDGGGRRLLIAAEIYPAIAVVAKLAGRVADNPWLAGGVVERGGHQTRVEWRGNLWTVQEGDGPDLSWSRRVPRVPVLALARLERGYQQLPPGTYLLTARPAAGGGSGTDFELALEGSAPPAPAPTAASSSPPILLAAAGPDGAAPPAAMALFDAGSTPPLHLPRAAVFHPPGVERWQLPAQGLAGFLGRGLPHGEAAGWSILALDRQSLTRAETLAPDLARLVPPTAVSGDTPALRLAIWIAPRPTLELVGRVRGLLEKVPLVARKEVRRWRDWEAVLQPLGRCDSISLLSTAGPQDAFSLVLHGCGSAAR